MKLDGGNGIGLRGPDLGVKLKRLPARPGVYRFLDRRGLTLYVGKAKSLRNRVRTYFRPNSQEQLLKTRVTTNGWKIYWAREMNTSPSSKRKT